jgi:HPt (histidine-containing phosphotransfer) domain-containing protein
MSSSVPGQFGLCRIEEAIARLAGYRDIYHETVTAFLAEEADYRVRLRAEVAGNDRHATHRTAHQLKGFAAQCGAVGVAQAASDLEQAALGNDVDLAPLLAALERHLAATCPQLADFRP